MYVIRVISFFFNHISKYPHRVRHDDVAGVGALAAAALNQRPVLQHFQWPVRCSLVPGLFPFLRVLFGLFLNCICRKGSCSLAFYHINGFKLFEYLKLHIELNENLSGRWKETESGLNLYRSHPNWFSLIVIGMVNRKGEIVNTVHFDLFRPVLKLQWSVFLWSI